MADGVKVYRLAEVMKHNGEGDAWMIIHNKIYDVSKWDNHPGGFLIQQGYGRDASALYESTHPESARAVMNKFYIGDLHAEDQTDKYTWDSPFYKTLKQRINDWFKENKVTNRQDHPELYIKMATVTICFPIFWYLALTSSSMILRYVYGTIASIFVAHFGISVMHDGCHGAFSRNPIVCALAAYYLDLLGASSFVWKHQHNIGHHSHTNTPQDPDAITAHPMIRVSPHREWKPWMQFQQFYAWILFCFVALRWMQKDIEVVFEGLYEPNIPLMKMDKTQRMVFWGGKAWFVFLFMLTPVFAFGLVEGLIFFMWAQILVSLQFALQFTVNHYENPCVFPSDKFPISDWAQLQVETTSNYGAGQRIWELWSGGLNYQIEHHLFPAISHPYYKHLSPIVQKTCKEYGVRYQNYPNFFEAVHGVYEHLKRWGTKPTSMKN